MTSKYKVPFGIYLLMTIFPFAMAQEFNTALMESTFQIIGHAKGGGPNDVTTGTVFILGRPVPGGKPGQTFNTLITAAHVLDGMDGDLARIVLRKKNSDGTYFEIPQPLQIKKNGVRFYTKHPLYDIAVMYVPLPEDLIPKVISTDILSTDQELERIEIHPGDILSCLGFPLSLDLNSFPVLRTGVLASYPLTPAKVFTQYFYNFTVFPGNSGGPVYYLYQNRAFGNALINAGFQVGIIGLVSQSVYRENQKLDVSIIVPAQLIREAIELLPATP